MNCFFASNHLSGLMDGELPENTRDEVEKHLETCPGCQHHWQELVALQTKLKAVKFPPLQQTPRVRVRYALLRQKMKGSWTRYFIFSPVSLVLIAAVIFGVAFWARRFPSSMSVSERAMVAVVEGTEKTAPDSAESAVLSAEKQMTTPTPLPTPNSTPTEISSFVAAAPATALPLSTPIPATPKTVVAATPAEPSTDSPPAIEASASPLEQNQMTEGLSLEIRVLVPSEVDFKELFLKECKKAKCRNVQGTKKIIFHDLETGSESRIVVVAQEFLGLLERIRSWGEINGAENLPEGVDLGQTRITLTLTFLAQQE